MREGFISISAVFTQLASQAPAHLPNFNVTGDEYVAHKVPTVPNCFYGNGTKKSVCIAFPCNSASQNNKSNRGSESSPLFPACAFVSGGGGRGLHREKLPAS